MKNLFVLFLTLIITYNTEAQQLKIASFNIRYDAKHDTVNNWHDRRIDVVNLIKRYSPDIIGIQEALSYQADYLDSLLIGYEYVGTGRDDGKTHGEYSAIFYKKERIKILHYMTVWLSESGDTGSVGWDAALPRIATLANAFDKVTKDTLFIINTHYDHQGEEAREESSDLLNDFTKTFIRYDKPVILTGDFNSTEDEEPIRKLTASLKDARKISLTKPVGPAGTFNGFYENNPNKRIDYIFLNKFRVLNYRTINEKRENGKFISDHYPVIIEAEIEK